MAREASAIRKTVGSTIIDPKLLTYAERLQYEGYLRRQETNEAILELSKQDVPIKQIVKRSGHSRKLVRCVLRGQRSDMFRVRQSSLEEWLPWLDGRWEQGARNASALWRMTASRRRCRSPRAPTCRRKKSHARSSRFPRV